MKAILEFNLPEDQEQFDAANRGMDWALVAWETDQLLRKKLKNTFFFLHVLTTFASGISFGATF